MYTINIMDYGDNRIDDIINYLKKQQIPNVEFISENEFSAADYGVIIVASFRNGQEYVDKILQNSNKIITIYEIMPFSFECEESITNSKKAYSRLKSAGINIVKVESDETYKTVGKTAKLSEIFTYITEHICEDIYHSLTHIDAIKNNMVNYSDEIKKNMITYTKEHSVTEFTSSRYAMMLTDNFGMTPTMYFVLYDRDFKTDCLSSEDKKNLLKQKNIFGHSIMDIACLSSFEQFKSISEQFELKEVQDICSTSKNNSKKSIEKKEVAKIATLLCLTIGAAFIARNPRLLKSTGKNIAHLTEKRLTKSTKKYIAKTAGKESLNITKIIHKGANTISDVGKIKGGFYAVNSLFTPKHKHKDNSFSKANSALEYTFELNRGKIMYDIDNTKEDSALLEEYKRKISALKNLCNTAKV